MCQSTSKKNSPHSFLFSFPRDDFDQLEDKIDKSVKNSKNVKNKSHISNKSATSSNPVQNIAYNQSEEKQKKDDLELGLGYNPLPETTKNLPPASQNRLLIAKLKVLETELSKQLEKNAKLQTNYNIANEKLKEYELTNSSNTKKLSVVTMSENKLKNQVEDYKKQIIDMTNAKINSDKELTKLMREDKSRTQKISQQELRLNRAVEEMEKYKSQVSKMKKENKDVVSKDSAKFDELISENKRLNRLMDDFKVTIKKQFKVVSLGES